MMKKSLIALAAVAAVGAASAQSSVTISGTLDPMFQNEKTTVGAGGSRSALTMESGKVGTSQVLFSGVEDLGGGLKGLFNYEMDFDTTFSGGGPTQGGQIFAGIQGGFGAVKMGVPNTPSLSTQVGRSPFGSKIGGGRGGLQLSGETRTRYSDTINYSTPNFGGFSAAYGFTPKLSAVTTATATPAVAALAASAEKTAINDLGVFYANGPIAAGVSVLDQKNVVNHVTGYVSYAFGPAKATLGAHRQDNKVASTNYALGKSQGWNAAIAYTVMPAVTLMGNYARTNDKSVANQDLTMFALGAQYALSKRTSLHARYIDEKRDNATGLVTKKLQTTLIGMQHNF